MAGPSNLPPAANLTRAGIGWWTEADFVRALREGKRPSGIEINKFMPWPILGRMIDEELHAISPPGVNYEMAGKRLQPRAVRVKEIDHTQTRSIQ